MATNISQRIKNLRESLGLGQAEFSDIIKVNQATISYIENGKTKPGYEVLQAILDKIDNVNPQWLMQDIGNMFLEEGQVNFFKKTYKDDESIIDFLKEQLREKDKIINKLLNSDKTTQTSGFVG